MKNCMHPIPLFLFCIIRFHVASCLLELNMCFICWTFLSKCHYRKVTIYIIYCRTILKNSELPICPYESGKLPFGTRNESVSESRVFQALESSPAATGSMSLLRSPSGPTDSESEDLGQHPKQRPIVL